MNSPAQQQSGGQQAPSAVVSNQPSQPKKDSRALLTSLRSSFSEGKGIFPSTDATTTNAEPTPAPLPTDQPSNQDSRRVRLRRRVKRARKPIDDSGVGEQPRRSLPTVSTADQLNVLDSVLNEVEQSKQQQDPSQLSNQEQQQPEISAAPIDSAVAQPVDQQAQPLDQQLVNQHYTQPPLDQQPSQEVVQQEQPELQQQLATQLPQSQELQVQSDLQQSQSQFQPQPQEAQFQPQDLGQISQALPQAIDQTAQQQIVEQPQQYSAGSGKEQLAGVYQNVEAAAGIQVVEQERNPEIPVEVEGYLQHVEDHAGQAPQEIVMSQDQLSQAPVHVPKQSVVVVPITPEIEKEGAKKSPFYSLRWLVEWSRKLMKMFNGKVIYREIDQAS